MPSIVFDVVHAEGLRNALLPAFTAPGLRQLLALAFTLDIDSIAPINANLIQQIEHAIAHFAGEGRIYDLLVAACDERPQDNALHRLRDEWQGMAFAPSRSLLQALLGRFVFAGVPPRPNLTGREALLAELAGKLTAGQSRALCTDGQGGVGKTALAAALAYHPDVLNHFANGVLWGGLGPSPNVAAVQAAWADALGAELSDVADTEVRRERLRRAVGDRKLLLVIDDAWQLEAAEALRLDAPGVAHLLTTRDNQLAKRFSQRGGTVEKVPPLEQEPGRALLRTLAPDAWNADPEQAAGLADALGGLPLAIEVVAGYLAGLHDEPVEFDEERRAALAAAGDPARRLALASVRFGGDKNQYTLEEIVEFSLADLAETARAAFYALGAFAPRPADFDREAALAVTGAELRTLSRLVSRNLLEKDGEERLALHQVVAEVAALGTPDEARERHRAHYLGIVTDNENDWQRIERVYAQAQHAAAHAPDEWVDLYEGAVKTYQQRRGLWADKLALLERVRVRAREDGDARNLAYVAHQWGCICDALGEKAQALKYYQQALELRRQSGDINGEATTLNNMGVVYNDWSEPKRALGYLVQAMTLHRGANDIGGEATVLNNIAYAYNVLGDKRHALQHYQQALILRRQVRDASGMAVTLNSIGYLYHSLGETHIALEHYEQALELRRALGDLGGEAIVLNNIGAAYSDLGERQRALECYEQARVLCRQVGDVRSEAYALSNIGAVYSALDEPRRALEHLEQALPLRRGVGDVAGEAQTLNNIGYAYAALGEKRRALEHYEQALALHKQTGDAAGEAGTLSNLAEIYLVEGDTEQAARLAATAYQRTAPYGLPIANDLFYLLAEILGSEEAAQAYLAEGAPSPTAGTGAPPAQQLDMFQAVELACGGDATLADRVYERLGEIVQDKALPPAAHGLAKALAAILDGEREPDLAGLPEELAAPVRRLLARLESGGAGED